VITAGLITVETEVRARSNLSRFNFCRSLLRTAFLLLCNLIYKDEYLFVCLFVWNLYKFTSEPIWTKLCTLLPLGLEETVGYVWTRNSLPLRPLGPFPLGATAESWTQDGCRRYRFPRHPYIRDSRWCSRDVTYITLSETAESFAAALYPWF